MNCIVVHYSEIAIKKGNRDFFERKLVDNMKGSLKGTGCYGIRRLYGSITIELGENPDLEKISGKLQKIPGIYNFSFAICCQREIGDLKKALDSIAEKRKIKTFAMSSARSYKKFKHSSKELNEILGEYMRIKHGWKVDLSEPDAKFFVEINEKNALVYAEKIRGMGGLPVSSGGRLVCLLSGGIDSPVAALEMMKRGCSVVFVHFHNWSRQQDTVRDKVERIVKVLSGYQPRTRLYMVPFGEIQRSLIMKVPAKCRMIVYRRVMLAIANRIAEKEKALGFVTGDSVGQVASQTLENLGVIYRMASLPVFAPLIGRNKDEIIRKAEEIGTYGLSILPYSDCCSFLVDRHPETRARIEDIETIESGLDIDKLVSEAVEKSEIKVFPDSVE